MHYKILGNQVLGIKSVHIFQKCGVKFTHATIRRLRHTILYRRVSKKKKKFDIRGAAKLDLHPVWLYLCIYIDNYLKIKSGYFD